MFDHLDFITLDERIILGPELILELIPDQDQQKPFVRDPVVVKVNSFYGLILLVVFFGQHLHLVFFPKDDFVVFFGHFNQAYFKVVVDNADARELRAKYLLV